MNAMLIRLFHPLPDEEPDPVTTANPEQERHELGPHQIAWLKRRVPHFRQCRRDVDRMIRAVKRNRDKHGERV